MLASRLLTILMLLQTRGRIAARELAARLEISVRTVYRDIDALSAAGVPVIADRGRTGGFTLLDGYRTDLTGMSAEEAELVMLAGFPALSAQLGLSQTTTQARLKLLAAVPAGAAAERMVSRVHLDPAGWFHVAEAAPLLPVVIRALREERFLCICYRQSDESRQRKIGPLGVVMKAGIWYLVGQRGSAYRSYRISRIVSAELADERYPRPQSFDLAAYWAESSRAFEQATLQTRCTLRLSPRGRRLLEMLGPHAEQSFAASAQPADRTGWVLGTILLESVDFGIREVLRLGEDAEIIAPAALRRAMAERLRNIQQRYRRPRRLSR
ncbi:MAG TPA: YafY family protein [Steroidobacteraceae bacterium]|nr:YafY family protein [Steroidobacteraceae bacterium]